MVLATVGELIEALSQFPKDKPVLGTWEGVTRELRVYPGFDKLEGKRIPVVFVDADFGRYQERLSRE